MCRSERLSVMHARYVQLNWLVRFGSLCTVATFRFAHFSYAQIARIYRCSVLVAFDFVVSYSIPSKQNEVNKESLSHTLTYTGSSIVNCCWFIRDVQNTALFSFDIVHQMLSLNYRFFTYVFHSFVVRIQVDEKCISRFSTAEHTTTKWVCCIEIDRVHIHAFHTYIIYSTVAMRNVHIWLNFFSTNQHCCAFIPF